MRQIKSRDNVRERGEVFTAQREVKAMCDMVGEDIADIEKRVLEPAAGNGNFLVVILQRRLNAVQKNIVTGNDTFHFLVALSNIYAVELDEKNVAEARQRLRKMMLEAAHEPNSEYEEAVDVLLKTNIICGDFLKFTLPEDMQFDIIIGNPPYQQSDGAGGQGSSAKPVYQHFIRQAKKLNPRYLSLIVPARWFTGGKGLDDFRNEMLADTRIRILHDYPDENDCFPNVSIKGGICYFLWDRDYRGKCKIITHINGKEREGERPLLSLFTDTFIRFPEQLSVVEKVSQQSENVVPKSFEHLVSVRKPFGLASDFRDFGDKPFDGAVQIFANKSNGFIKRNKIERNAEWIDRWKVYITFAYGAGSGFPHQILNKPFLGEPNTCTTETNLVVGPFADKQTTENVISYIKTRFFRFLVLIKKLTQNATKEVYQLVPMQDFSESWTDAKLYAKYGLSAEEINFIERMIRPME